MTFLRMQLRVREYINEAVASSWSDAELKAWLNMEKDGLAVELIERDNSYLVGSDTISTTAGMAEYSIAGFEPTVFRIISVQRTDSDAPREINRVDLADVRSFRSNGYQYYLRGDYIVLQPKPTTSTTDFATIYYNYIPADMSGNADTSGLPAQLDESLVLGAAVRAFARYDDTNINTFAAMYQERKGMALSALAKRSGRRGVRVVEGVC